MEVPVQEDEGKKRVYGPKVGKGLTIDRTFPWAGTERAIIRSLESLLSAKINTITGTVQCKICKGRLKVQYDILEKFEKLKAFIVAEKPNMQDKKAPYAWQHPKRGSCYMCLRHNTMEPLIWPKKQGINWLFLLLGQTIGFCNEDQLRYLCKHNHVVRSGNMEELIYNTYFCLCKMLQPIELFDL
ncbi:hypothetical protein QJS04_geneDACA006335 [Acorus gramineus]|uniref:DUF7086 domain-containing protein n=1 Tax=Acorus gramineus TaxID=55184 RepID=A0AAV9AVN5_ACOGR|nr:hypothetical protein QJS04_geneDACA006335 [Acorus gramineus]